MKAGVTEICARHGDARPRSAAASLIWVVSAINMTMVSCSAPRAVVTSPAPLPRETLVAPLALPPIPLVDGPLKPMVRYPSEGALIQARDSNFLFGTIGNGRATLTINGDSVTVAPNGGYLAFLPVPPASASRYDLVAVLGPDTVRASHAVRVLPPLPVLADTGRLVVDSGSVVPRERFWLRDEELVRVAIRAPSNVTAWVRTGDGMSVPLVRASERQPKVVAMADSARASRNASGVLWQADLPARTLRPAPAPAGRLRDTGRGTELLVTRGADTVRFSLVTRDTTAVTGLVILGGDSSAVSDTDRVVAGRSIPGGTTKWLLLPGTVVEATGRVGAMVRVRLDAMIEIWVEEAFVRPLDAGVARPRRTAGDARVVPGEDWADLIIPMSERPAYYVEPQERSLVLTLYGTQGNTEHLRYLGNDSTIRVVHWEQVASDRARYTIHLAHAPFGHLVFWERGALVVRVRRQPPISRQSPLRGLRIVVDAGHPPAGATGVTGLYEAVPVLAVAEIMRTMLEARGATAVMTRTTDQPLALGERPIIARRANGHAFVSIHLNAFGDGVNPFVSHGTGTYFYHTHSEPLARAIQRRMVLRMGLPDLGRYHESFAVTRNPYMPAVLTEGAFLMFPDQENALRTEPFQRAYAESIVEGLEDYFRTLAP